MFIIIVLVISGIIVWNISNEPGDKNKPKSRAGIIIFFIIVAIFVFFLLTFIIPMHNFD